MVCEWTRNVGQWKRKCIFARTESIDGEKRPATFTTLLRHWMYGTLDAIQRQIHLLSLTMAANKLVWCDARRKAPFSSLLLSPAANIPITNNNNNNRFDIDSFEHSKLISKAHDSIGKTTPSKSPLILRKPVNRTIQAWCICIKIPAETCYICLFEFVWPQRSAPLAKSAIWSIFSFHAVQGWFWEEWRERRGRGGGKEIIWSENGQFILTLFQIIFVVFFCSSSWFSGIGLCWFLLVLFET